MTYIIMEVNDGAHGAGDNVRNRRLIRAGGTGLGGVEGWVSRRRMIKSQDIRNSLRF